MVAKIGTESITVRCGHPGCKAYLVKSSSSYYCCPMGHGKLTPSIDVELAEEQQLQKEQEKSRKAASR